MKNKIFRLAFTFICLMGLRNAGAQVTVSLVLSPPYSPYFSDYLTYENKTVITIIKTGLSGYPNSIYFRGKIEGDNGVLLATKPNYKPGTPIDLPTTATTIKGDQIGEYFTWENTEIKGTTAANLIKNNGLPEGNYTICITPYDYASDAVVGTEACFMFKIVQPEPPVITGPICNGKVIPTPAQTVVFSWSPSPGTVNASYVLTIAEMANPEQNPNDALNTITTPPFFQQDLNTFVYVYKLSDPALTVGKTYAWRVQVYDPLNKTSFRNNGIGEACTFTYAAFGSPSITTGKSLVITAPNCDVKTDSIIVSSETKALFSWVWQAQIDDSKLLTNPYLLNFKGQRISKYDVRIIAMEASSSPIKSKPPTFTVSAPNQRLELTLKQVKDLGLLDGKKYKLNVIAYDSAGGKMADTSSCEFRFYEVVEKQPGQIMVYGKIVYKFTDGTELKPANFTDASIQLNPKPDAFTSPDPIDFSKNYMTFTTDENGAFSCLLNLNPSDTAEKDLGLFIRSSYYKPLSAPIKVNLSYQKKNEKGKIINYGQKDTLNLGAIVCTVYSYDLKVVVGKGFPSFFVDSATKTVKSNVSIDTFSINPKSKVKAGITVRLYRKTKHKSIPFFESGANVQAGSKPGEILVAEGKTIIENAGTSSEKTIVEFNNLICNFIAGDKYFIKAVIPPKKSDYSSPFGTSPKGGYNPKTMGAYKYYGPMDVHGEFETLEAMTTPNTPPSFDEDQDVTAPEMEVVFDMDKFKSNITRYAMTVNYKLISTIPPLSEIKGKLVYAWPSDPNVVRPMANARFYVTLTYRLNQKPIGPPKSDNICEIVQEKFKLSSGDKYNLDMNDENMIVGSGETDGQGNFTIKIINHNTKGILSNKAVKQTYTIKNPKCDKNTPVEKENPKDKLDWIKNEKMGVDILGEGGINEKNVLDFGGGMNSKTSNGFSPATNINGFNSNSLTGVGAGGFDAGKQFGSKGFGPSEQDELSPEILEAMLVYNILERGFEIKLDYAWAKHYSTINGGIYPTFKGNYFTINPFESKSVGTFTAMVDEIMTVDEKKIKLEVYSPTSKKIIPGVSLAGGKCVVFRLKDTKISNKPEGEGTANHPSKKLLVPTFSTYYSVDDDAVKGGYDYKNGTFEWVLDTAMDLSFDGANSYISFQKSKLLKSTGKYYLQICPNPQNSGKTFEPVIVPYEVETVKVSLRPSRIVGRLMDKSSKKGVEGKVALMINSKPYSVKTLDKYGYFEIINNKFANGGQFFSWGNGTKYYYITWPDGYKLAMGPPQLAIIDAEGTQNNHPIEVEPAGRLKGTIVDESGKPIEAYIIRNDSTVFDNLSYNWKYGIFWKNLTTGSFEIPVTSKTTHKIKIVPKDVGYFDTTITTYVNFEKDLGKIVIYRRKHRIVLQLSFKNANGTPLPLPAYGFPKNTVEAIVNNDKTKSAKNAHVGNRIIIPPFENVSVNSYTVFVKAAGGQGYIPLSINIINSETREPVYYDVIIYKGLTISGKVTLNSQPLANAKVYVDYKGTSSPTSEEAAYSAMETRSAKDGSYTITGIPKVSESVKVYATLDTNFIVTGSSADVNMKGADATVNFSLKKIDDGKIDNLYGFPLSIEKIEKTGEGRYKVTGLVGLTKGQTAFQWLDPNYKVRVIDVEFSMKNGVGIPVNSSQELDATPTMKMKYMNRYNVNLTGSLVKKTPANLKIQKLDAYGVLQAYAPIVDNSFNFPSTYLKFDKNDLFFLAISNQGSFNNKVQAISSDPGTVKPKYHLTDYQNKPLTFTFIGFAATANPANSYIDEAGKIHLNVEVNNQGSIPQLGKVSFKLPDLVIDNNKVEKATGSEPLVINLQTWKLQVNNWTVDPTKGGLVSSDCIIKTGIVDIPASEFNLRSDFFVLKNFQLNKISLGGGVLNLSDISKSANLVFDEKCGYDLAPHWRFVIGKSGPGGHAALISGLSPYINQAIPLDYIQLISNGKDNILSMGNISGIPNLFKNDKITFIPTQIVSGSNYFNLSGTAKIAVPRFPDVLMSINFTGTPGSIKAKLEPMKFSFEAPGYVNVTSDDSKAIVMDESSGKMTISCKAAEPGKFNPIPCKLVFGGGENGRVYLTENEKVYLVSTGSSGPRMELSADINKNGMWVDGSKDWNNFKFSGKYYDNSEGIIANPPVMDFIVYGEISASSSQVSMNEISTPFGNLKMTYDFAKKQLYGLLVIAKGTKIGKWEIDGQVETYIDPQGFIVVGLGSVNTGKLFVDGFGLFKIGFVLGGYPLTNDMITKATTYAVNPAAACWLQANKSNFKGFWFCGNNHVINEHYDFYAIIASAYIHADAVLEASLGVNFGGSGSFEINVGAFGNVEAGMSAITGTSISGSLNANATAKIAYKSASGMSFDAHGDFSIKYEICQSLIATEVCFGDTKGAQINFGYNGGTYFDFSLEAPGAFQGCPK